LNTAISFYRKEQTTLAISEQVIDMKEEGNELEDKIREMQQYINEFNELDRALMILYLEKKSHKEIAEILGISESNVGTKISRMKERLRQRLSNP
jgi:RNA polymerase sigma-70 factor (ECF subfamily)